MPKATRTIFAADDGAMGTTVKSKRPGRRPSGPDGERVSDYPHVMIRLPQATKQTLDALSGITGTPVWQLVDRAIGAYLRQLPAAEQRLVADVKTRRARIASES